VQYEKIAFVCNWIVKYTEIDNDDSRSVDATADEFAVDDDGDEGDDDPDTKDIQELIQEHNRKRRNKALIKKLQQADGEAFLIECKKLIDMTNFLSSFQFANSVLADCSIIGSSNKVSIHSAYVNRLSVWTLLQHPFEILDFLFVRCPEDAVKLLPLHTMLNISKEEFYFRKLKAAYLRYLAVDNKACSLIPTEAEAKRLEFIIRLEEDVLATSLSLGLQAQLWELIYEEEVKLFATKSNFAVAIKVAENALSVYQSPSFPRCPSADAEHKDQRRESILLRDLVQHRITNCLEAGLSTYPNFKGLFDRKTNFITDPGHLYRYHCLNSPQEHYLWPVLLKLFEDIVQFCWCAQIKSVYVGGETAGSIYTVMAADLADEVVDFLRTAASALTEVICVAVDTERQYTPSAKKSDILHQQTQLLVSSLQQHMIAGVICYLDAEKLTETTLPADKGTVEKAGQAPANIWEMCDAGNLCGQPTQAEVRRGEDVFSAFSLAVVSMLNEDHASAVSLINNLLAPAVLGKHATGRSNRKVAGRSRFRAIQAIYFLTSPTNKSIMRELAEQNNPSPVNLFSDRCGVVSARAFLFILAEQLECRILCSEETLADALGITAILQALGLISSANVPSSTGVLSPSSLVRTWLHDEGSRLEPVELARDLIYICGSVCDRRSTKHSDADADGAEARNVKTLCDLWGILFDYCTQYDYHQVIIQSLCMLRGTQVAQLLFPRALKSQGVTSTPNASSRPIGIQCCRLEDNVAVMRRLCDIATKFTNDVVGKFAAVLTLPRRTSNASLGCRPFGSRHRFILPATVTSQLTVDFSLSVLQLSPVWLVVYQSSDQAQMGLTEAVRKSFEAAIIALGHADEHESVTVSDLLAHRLLHHGYMDNGEESVCILWSILHTSMKLIGYALACPAVNPQKLIADILIQTANAAATKKGTVPSVNYRKLIWLMFRFVCNGTATVIDCNELVLLLASAGESGGMLALRMLFTELPLVWCSSMEAMQAAQQIINSLPHS
jgi:hypothetical protein